MTHMIRIAMAGVCLYASGALGATWYVHVNSAAQQPDGVSWATAFKTIQEGIDAAFGAGGGEVWVAAGTYNETRATSDSNSLVLKAGVALYGGFTGSETARDQRDWTANTTVIDGNTAGGRAYHVVIGANNAILDGFTVTGGNANGPSPHIRGGGIYNISASPTIANCTIAGNTAQNDGGGMHNSSANPSIANCVFSNNRVILATGRGGGINNANAAPIIDACVFYTNQAANGGAIANRSASSASIVNCVFRSNSAALGGAIHNDGSAPDIRNCTINGNAATTNGGGVYNKAAAPNLVNGIVWSNTPDQIFDDATATPTISYCDIQGGYASGTNVIALNPLFVNAAAGDLQLKNDSPCIDAGSDAEAPSTDILGVARPQCASADLGAYEQEPPVVRFTASALSGVVPANLQFTDASCVSDGAVYDWDFGDGNSSAEPSPSHTYTAYGTFTVALTIGNASTSKQVTIAAKPTAAFTANATSGPAPLDVRFTDQSAPGSSPITQWGWSFGDGQTSTSQNPDHTYAEPGTYNVALTATNVVGESTVTKTAYVTVTAPVPPQAAFTANFTTGASPLTVFFTDQSAAGTWPITGWQWDFGDGQTSTTRNPSHSYTQDGVYDVTLTVTAQRGTVVDQDTEVKNAYIFTYTMPVAAFTAEQLPASGIAPLTVNFIDQSIEPAGHPITTREWNFGDQQTSSEKNPQHVYTAAGTYTVSLTVTTDVGKSDTKTIANFVTVTAMPYAEFSADPVVGLAPLSVQFTDLSTPGSQPIVQWIWDFGDQTATGSERNPAHTYVNPGVYTVQLSVSTTVGSDQETKMGYITVNALPVAGFAADSTYGYAPMTVHFTDQSTPGSASITVWAWNFGDGLQSAAPSPDHTFAEAGDYDVTLTVTTTVGSDSATRIIRVRRPPMIVTDAAVLPTATVGEPYEFTFHVVQGTPPYHWTISQKTEGLPPGLELTDAGVLQGTPTLDGAYTFRAHVSDQFDDTAEKGFTLTVIKAPIPGEGEGEGEGEPPAGCIGSTASIPKSGGPLGPIAGDALLAAACAAILWAARTPKRCRRSIA